MLASSDKQQLQAQGITEQQLQDQISRFEKGFEPLILAAAATVDNGIMRLSESEIAAHDVLVGSLGEAALWQTYKS